MPKSAIDAETLENIFKKHAHRNRSLFDVLSDRSQEQKDAFIKKMDDRHLQQQADR